MSVDRNDEAAVPAELILTQLEGRVLGVLIEKQRAVPDTYPLSLNALHAGCNQKTSREPVLDATENELLVAIEGLRANDLVIESSGGRVTRYAHNAERVLHLPSQAVAIVAVLLLRGPQTAAELRANCERLHRFVDTSAVEGFLEELAARATGALVLELPRQPGTRETRWVQTLTGVPPLELVQTGAEAATRDTANPGLATRVAALEAEVAALKEAQARILATLEGRDR